MDTTIDTVRTEMQAGFAEVNARINELHREVTARLDDQRKELSARMYDQHRELSVRMDDQHRELSARMDDQHRELSARMDDQHRELSARMDDQRREFAARSDALRAEMLENFKFIEAKIELVRAESQASHRESMVLIQNLQNRFDEHRRESEVQFRWLVGLILASLLGIAGLFAKAALFY